MKISVNLFLVLLTLTALPVLTGCGIKPSEVSAPGGEEHDDFPRTYPDPSTFQRPETK